MNGWQHVRDLLLMQKLNLTVLIYAQNPQSNDAEYNVTVIINILVPVYLLFMYIFRLVFRYARSWTCNQ